MEVLSWNEVAVGSLIFGLDTNAFQSVWHKWMRLFVLKGQTVCSVWAKQTDSVW